MNFTVIVEVRHQFGNDDLNIGVYSGQEASFPFNCPNVDTSQTAVLLFQGQQVSIEHVLEINGTAVAGGIPPGPIAAGFTSTTSAHAHTAAFPSFGWSGFVMLVHSNVLRTSNNVMRVASSGGAEFVIDNVVILYKTRMGPIVVN
jgi:hypothetical protein